MPSPKPRYKEVSEPAVSANQLAAYLTAGPAARKRIVRDARWQSTAVVARYQQARKALATCLCDLTKSPATFAAQRKGLADRLEAGTGTSWTQSDLEASVEALDRYAATINATGVAKLNCKAVSGSTPPLMIGGTRVKVTPDVTVHRSVKGQDAQSIGAVVMMIAKGEGSSTKRKEQARTAAVLVWLFAQKHLDQAGVPDRNLCYSYDVFDGALVPAGSSITNRIKNIEAACEEIASAWMKATPPDDLD